MNIGKLFEKKLGKQIDKLPEGEEKTKVKEFLKELKEETKKMLKTGDNSGIFKLVAKAEKMGLVGKK